MDSAVAARAKPHQTPHLMSIYFLLTAAGLILFAIAGVLLWLLVRGGQLDDLDTPPIRMLHDDPIITQSSSEHGDIAPSNSSNSSTKKDHA